MEQKQIQLAKRTIFDAQQRLNKAQEQLSSLNGWWLNQLDKYRQDLAKKQSDLEWQIRDLRKALGHGSKDQ